MYRVEDLAPNNSGYQVQYDPRRSAAIAGAQLDHALYRMHSRVAYNGELSRNTEVGYKPVVPWNNNIYKFGTYVPSAYPSQKKRHKTSKKVRFS